LEIPKFRHPIQIRESDLGSVVQIAAELVAAVKKTGIPGVLVSTSGVEEKLAVDPGGGRLIADFRAFYQGYKG